jgi:nucleoid-associated protein
MPTQINRIIIHELKKEATSSSAEIILFDSLIDAADNRIVGLVTQLNKRYKESNEKYGVFDPEAPTIFHSAFQSYFDNDEDQKFINFSRSAAQNLKDRIENIPAAKGGYLVFVDFNINYRFVGVFLVRNTSGISFRMSQSQFNIDDVQHIDVENLAMAGRINLNLFSGNETRYLSFINNKQDSVSKFFIQWISSTELESNKKDTENLYQLFKTVDIPIDPETGIAPDQTTFFNNIHSVIISAPGRRVTLRGLSEELFGDPEFLIRECESRGIRINGEFKADAQVLKKFVHVKVKADNIDLAFPLNAYRNTVSFDENNQNRIIIESQRLAEKIREIINDTE